MTREEEQSCHGVTSVPNIGTQVQMLMETYKNGDPYVPEHISLLSAGSVIQEVGWADVVGGIFVSKPFRLFSGITACVLSKNVADVYAYIKAIH